MIVSMTIQFTCQSFMVKYTTQEIIYLSDPLKISSTLARTTAEICAQQNLQKEVYNGRVKHSSGYSALNVIDIQWFSIYFCWFDLSSRNGITCSILVILHLQREEECHWSSSYFYRYLQTPLPLHCCFPPRQYAATSQEVLPSPGLPWPALSSSWGPTTHPQRQSN